MNDRIKILAEQAGFGLRRDVVNAYGEIYTSRLEHLPITEDLAKFAELIVQECAEIAKKVDGDESDDYQSGRTWAGIDVLEHFGVKE